MNTTAYRIENLDVYRKSIALGTRIYQLAGNGAANGHSQLGERVRRTTLAMVLNLAAGLGYWEKDAKATHFAASKQAIMEMAPLLELMVALGEVKPDAEALFTVELQDLGKMVNGLLRQAKRREAQGDDGGNGPAAAEARERAPLPH
jgi:four helix bundle protein